MLESTIYELFSGFALSKEYTLISSFSYTTVWNTSATEVCTFSTISLFSSKLLSTLLISFLADEFNFIVYVPFHQVILVLQVYSKKTVSNLDKDLWIKIYNSIMDGMRKME